jgi:hypothetical protein
MKDRKLKHFQSEGQYQRECAGHLCTKMVLRRVGKETKEKDGVGESN